MCLERQAIVPFKITIFGAATDLQNSCRHPIPCRGCKRRNRVEKSSHNTSPKEEQFEMKPL